MNKKLNAIAAAALSTTVLVSALMTDTAQAGYTHNDNYVVTTKAIPVKLVRGEQVEYGRLVYKGWVNKVENQTGSVSKPLTGKFVDNRQCNWQISGRMQRQYFVTSITGKEDSQPAAILNIPLNYNGNSNGLASFLDHDPCSDYRGQINNHVASMKNQVAAQFDQKMNEDLMRFQIEMQGVTVVINP